MKILITGGTGLIGKRLTWHLQNLGHEVLYLSRKAHKTASIPTYAWKIEQGYIEQEALLQADYIIHLAGAGIADKPWTTARKQEIIHSRTASIELIAQQLQQLPHRVKGFVSASGIGYYGSDTGDKLVDEQSPAGNDFVAQCTIAWEQASEQIAQLGIRTSKLRIGIVLAKDGGALPKMSLPIKWGVGAALGSGKQYMSWIHIDDLCRLFIAALFDNSFVGVYNAVAPNPVSNKLFTQLCAKALHRPLWLPNVPAFALKIFLGEMASLVLGGNKISNQKLQQTSFQFTYTDAQQALTQILQ